MIRPTISATARVIITDDSIWAGTWIDGSGVTVIAPMPAKCRLQMASVSSRPASSCCDSRAASRAANIAASAPPSPATTDPATIARSQASTPSVT